MNTCKLSTFPSEQVERRSCQKSVFLFLNWTSSERAEGSCHLIADGIIVQWLVYGVFGGTLIFTSCLNVCLVMLAQHVVQPRRLVPLVRRRVCPNVHTTPPQALSCTSPFLYFSNRSIYNVIIPLFYLSFHNFYLFSICKFFIMKTQSISHACMCL
jgi:hypothetical protein